MAFLWILIVAQEFHYKYFNSNDDDDDDDETTQPQKNNVFMLSLR